MPILPLDYSRPTTPAPRAPVLTYLSIALHVLAAAGVLALLVAQKFNQPVTRLHAADTACALTALAGMILLILTLILNPAGKPEYLAIAVDVLFWIAACLA